MTEIILRYSEPIQKILQFFFEEAHSSFFRPIGGIDVVFDKALMSSIERVFKGDVGALLTLFKREAGGVEERVIRGVYDESRHLNLGDTLLTTTF